MNQEQKTDHNLVYYQDFDIVIAKKFGGKLSSAKHAGMARFDETQNIYLLRLNIFPRHLYFLSKNPSSTRKYTVFSKTTYGDNGVKYHNPVGKAELLRNLKTHLQIDFLMPRMTFYMSLFPKDDGKITESCQ